MSEPLPTVKIASDHPDHGGFIVINKDDYDPKTHQLFEVAEAAPQISAKAARQAKAREGQFQGTAE